MSSFHKRAKDLHRCLRSLQSFSDGQARISSWDEEQIKWVKLTIIPNEGAYKNGKFNFEIQFPECYPATPPNVMCTSSIYHPNIDITGDEYNVCLNLFDEWQTTNGIEDCVQGLLFLLYNPNLEDPLSPFFAPDMMEDDFLENVKNSLKGGEIDDFDYPANNVIDLEEEGGDKVEDVELVLARVEKLVDASQDEEASDEDDQIDEEPEYPDDTTNVEDQAINEDKPLVILSRLNSTTNVCSTDAMDVINGDNVLGHTLTRPSQHTSVSSIPGCLPIHLDPMLTVASLGIYLLAKVIHNRVQQSRIVPRVTEDS